MAKKTESIESLLGDALVEFDKFGSWPAWSTGVPLIDIATGIGGLPKGRIIENYGPESSGKSTIFLRAAANAQRQGKKVVFLDYENSFDPMWATKLGIDVNGVNEKGERTFIVATPEHLQQGIGIILEIIDNHPDVALVIVDSLAMMVPKQDLEDTVDSNGQVGLKARLMSKWLPVITAKQAKAKSETSICFINQLREDVGGYNPTGQKRLTTPGGRALKFAASLRIEFQKIGSESAEVLDEIELKKEKRVVAHKIQATVTKNKVGPPFKRTRFFCREGVGIDVAGSVREIALSRGIITSRGAWCYVPGRFTDTGEEEKVNGKVALASYFAEGTDRFKKLEEEVVSSIASSEVVSAEYEDEDDDLAVPAGMMDLGL